MESLRVHLLGGLELYRGDQRQPAFPSQHSEKLFAYLALNHGRMTHRDVLCGQFWGGQSETDARKSLRTALWRIRSVLEPTQQERGGYVRVEGHLIGFAEGQPGWVDVAEFEASARLPSQEGETPPAADDAARLARAASLYRGDFLEGHYDEWCLVQRERLRLTLLTAIEWLVAHHCAAGNWLDAIGWARQLLQVDPLREHIHRTLMTAHLAMGDRPSALRQYHTCARQLREELEIEPMLETRELYDAARDDRRPPPPPPGGGVSVREERAAAPRGLAAEVEGALRQLYAVADRLEATRKALWLNEGTGMR